MDPFPRPLTNTQINFLDSVLEAGRGPIQNFEMLDGFLAALVAGPELLMPSQYFPLLLGEDTGPSAPLATLQEAERFFQYLMQHWNLQVSTFMAGEPWSLWVALEDNRHEGREWARGFQVGTDLGSGWDRLSKAQTILLGAIMLLAEDGAPRPKRRPLSLSELDRAAALEVITYGLPGFYAETRPVAVQPKKPRTAKGMPRKKKARRKR